MLCGVNMVLFRSDFLAQKLFVLALLLSLAGAANAQSTDPNTPSPVRSNTVTARIAARDLGDARLTDHYYAFTGTPGDLLITIQSNNLNGDVDIFTAGTLRPLGKVTLYAEISSPVTKGIYLRRREDLIMRIEARSPNDDEGIYRVTFGGSFQAIVGGPDLAEAETPSTTETPAGARKGKRVTSSGARIDEPAPPVTEVAAAPTPEPTPEAKPEAKPVETPKTEEKPPEEKPTKPAPVRNTRPRRPPTPRKSTPPRTRDTTASTDAPKPKQPPVVEPEPEVGPRLVIETNDGTLINRSMSTVRRVTVENGQVVVIGKDGKIERILLVNVVRMSIAP